MLAAFQAHPPDWIAVVPKDTSEYGYRGFGLDYGERIALWISQNYQEVPWVGAPSPQNERFGIWLLQKANMGRGER